MTTELEVKTICKIQKLYSAMQELNQHWSENEEELHFLENLYPFEMDLTDQTLEVGYWLDYQKEYLNKQ